MQLVAADLLAEARGLSYPVSIAGVVLGIMLWLFGWRWHKFWIVLTATVGAGLYGLIQQGALGPRMLAAGLLLAVAVGLLALEMSKLVAFAAGGLSGWFVVHAIVPTFQEPVICFLAGGILGVFLYRLQWMLLSSTIGILLLSHSLLLLIEKATGLEFSAADWAKENALGLNIGVIVVTLLGLAVQGQLERWREAKPERENARALAALTDEERETVRTIRERGWLSNLVSRQFRRDDPRHRRSA